MATVNIRGIPVNFPYAPYEIQKKYMEKVIDCLQNRQNGVLESPTGTGKTLSLLCASLAWLEVKKAQIQAQRTTLVSSDDNPKELNSGTSGRGVRGSPGMPKIIYASRTHSQLSQAMQELKKTKYSHMKATVLGSREQMCVHEEVLNEKSNAMKIQLCRLKVKSRSCHYFNRVERKKDDPAVTGMNIIDIEDLVKMGKCHKFCPYYMAKELKQQADVVFMPYNYLLDPKVGKALGVELANNVVILDEAHNIDKICEESASVQIKSSDITLCIEEVTAVMKAVTDEVSNDFNEEASKEFTAEELCGLKQMLLDFEKVLGDVVLSGKAPEDTYFEGDYIFEMFDKAGISDGNYNTILNLCDKLIQFLATTSDGPFARRGNGVQLFSDLLTIVYASVSPSFKEKIKKCYKVHFAVEETRKKGGNDWLSKVTSKSRCRILSFWCFSPGFGMNMFMEHRIHCVILTSGTLAPLKPLISELELDVGVRLENPHIVTGKQVCVKILTKGPDMEPLNCNYHNRDNPKYIRSLGTVISNLIRVIPGGVLIFFPSYPIMLKCQQFWQDNGIWGGITQTKQIYVEPRDKNTFNAAMNDYYEKINDPNCKGAIFMGVCRGKVSEGLDFVDINGRAVFITGLPYPPLKDPRVILKKRYLDACHSKDKECLTGDEWYSLEATRAINQAIGRVIRHRHDYGAIILLDSRFMNSRIKMNMSKWLQQHIKVMLNFGETIRDLRIFFRNAQEQFPVVNRLIEVKENVPLEPEIPQMYRHGNFDWSTSSLPCTSNTQSDLVNIHKRKSDVSESNPKKTKITVLPIPKAIAPFETSIKEFTIMVKKALDAETFSQFINTMSHYRANNDFDALKQSLDAIFLPRKDLCYIIRGVEPYLKDYHKEEFQRYCEKMQLL